ncbi:hypothetical protein BLOT_001483 [Blomia tropicalis]|nr:hypothetical protein BLOT_001483 [Blomia tropicalis]
MSFSLVNVSTNNKWMPTITNGAAFALVLLLFQNLCPIHCEEECLRSKVRCYECESTTDPFCGDPFNVTYAMESMMMCQGCCVKVVRRQRTPQKYIWRTCTTRLQINLFMVDHVCMDESGGQGQMCFCESDGCNWATPTNRPQPLMIIAASTIVTLLSSCCWTSFDHYRLSHSNAYRLIATITMIVTLIVTFIKIG